MRRSTDVRFLWILVLGASVAACALVPDVTFFDEDSGAPPLDEPDAQLADDSEPASVDGAIDSGRDTAMDTAAIDAFVPTTEPDASSGLSPRDSGADADEASVPPPATCPNRVPPGATGCCGDVACVGKNCKAHCGDCAGCAGDVCCVAGSKGAAKVTCAPAIAGCGKG